MNGTHLENGIKLLEALSKIFPDSSNRTLRQWIKHGRVSLEGKIEKNANAMVEKSQKIELLKEKKDTSYRGIKILYDDNHIVVISKKNDILSVDSNDPREESVHTHLKEKYYPTKIYPVHRLDREVSGLLVFAKNQKAKEILKEDFHDHIVQRKYIALVEGNIKTKKGFIKTYLFQNKNFEVSVIYDSNKGKRAITHYNVLGYGKNTTLLAVQLETGRKNQIRVHFQHVSHPVLGDTKYGSKKEVKRICLHAYELKFTHPIGKKELLFKDSIPKSFSSIIKEEGIGEEKYLNPNL